MSNLSQFKRNSLPIGSQLLSLRTEPLVTESDGSVWYKVSPESPFTYTSDYSYMPEFAVTNHALLTGPETDGSWQPRLDHNIAFNVAYNPSGPLYVCSTYGIDNTGVYYYTSSNGSTWTKRYQPNSIVYDLIHFTGGRFIMTCTATTTSGVMTSPDGINWVVSNGSSASTNALDIAANSNFGDVIVVSSSGSMFASNGNNWTSVASITGVTNATKTPGCGILTYNSGAGLYLIPTTSGYLTSANGQTWTARTPRSFNAVFAGVGTPLTRFASNSTTTLAINALNGVYATSTDGLTWSNYGRLEVPQRSYQLAYHDGTRFVVKFENFVYYTTDLVNWTKVLVPLSGQATSATGANRCWQSGGVLFISPFFNTKTKILMVSNVASTTKQTVWPTLRHADSVDLTNFNLYIKVR